MVYFSIYNTNYLTIYFSTQHSIGICHRGCKHCTIPFDFNLSYDKNVHSSFQINCNCIKKLPYIWNIVCFANFAIMSVKWCISNYEDVNVFDIFIHRVVQVSTIDLNFRNNDKFSNFTKKTPQYEHQFYYH